LSPRLAGKWFGVLVALALALPALSQSTIKPSLLPTPRSAHAPKETSTTLRVLILVSGLLVLVVVVSRWKKIRRRASLSRSAWPASASKHHHHTHGGLFSSHGHHHRRHHRREHRQRNPTLAETGGLPPIRSEIQPPPPT
jgi:hypothetical protein